MIRDAMREHLGIVTPVYFPDGTPHDEIRAMLTATLQDIEAFVRPENVAVVVDGVPWLPHAIAPVLTSVEERSGSAIQLQTLDANVGKGGAVASGMALLLQNPSLTHIAIRDDDGDHCVYDLPDLYRLSLEMAQATSTDLTVANGRRVEIHRPLGMERGFFETMLNEITYDSVKFALALTGRALNTCWHSAYGAVPDLESGYKIYSRAAAELFIKAIAAADELCPGTRMTHFGVEIAPTVEVLMAGGILGESMRTTMQSQPVTTFMTGERLAECYGTEATWLFRRLGLPTEAADTLMANAISRCGYGRGAGGAEALQEFRSFVLRRLGANEEAPLRVPERF